MKRERNVRGQKGSTFILVLIALVVITFLGISLTFVTEIEMQLGGTEKILTQNFFGAESGIQVPVGGVLATNAWEGKQFAFVEGRSGERYFGRRIYTTAVQAAGAPQVAPFTAANEGSKMLYSFSVIFRGTSERVSWPVPGATPGPGLDGATPPAFPGEPGDSQVTVQSRSSVLIRYLLSPIPGPNPEKPYNPTASPVVF